MGVPLFIYENGEKMIATDLTTKTLGDIINEDPEDFQRFCDDYLSRLTTEYLHHKAAMLRIGYGITFEGGLIEEGPPGCTR